MRRDGFYWCLVAGEWEPVRVRGGEVELLGTSAIAEISGQGSEYLWEWASVINPVCGGERLDVLQAERQHCKECDPPANWCKRHQLNPPKGDS